MPAVLVFHGQATAAVAARVNQALRQKYPLASSVVVASIVDLRDVPRLFRSFATGALQKSYQEAAASLPPGLSAEEYVLILPDWGGAVTQAAGLDDTNRAAGAAVLDPSGAIVGICQGDNLAETALTMLEQIAS